MVSDNFEQISNLIMRLNELSPSPVCSTELTNLSKLIQESVKINKEFEEAGRLQKRGLKKDLESAQKKIIESKESCLQCIFDTIVSSVKPILDHQVNALSAISPKAASLIRNLVFPLTSEISSLTSFIEELNQVQMSTISEVKRTCNVLLQENKAKIRLYSELITINLETTSKTNSLSEDALGVMSLGALLETFSILKKEGDLINKQLSASIETVQQKLLSTCHELLSAIQEGAKRNIISNIDEYQEIDPLLSQIEIAKTIDELNELNSKISSYTSKFSSILKSEITRIKTLNNQTITQVRNLFPTLSDKWMPESPEISISKASIAQLMNYNIQMNNWKKEILDGLKNIASVEELNQVTEGAIHEGVSIPNTLLANTREISKQVQEKNDIEEAFKELTKFHTYYTEYLQILRDEISQNLNFEATDSDSKALISLKPPLINLKSDSPSELLNYLRSVSNWQRRLINVLQEARHAINDTIATVNQLMNKGITNFPPDFQSELTTLYEKMASETDVQTLLLYRRSYDRLYKQFVTMAAAYIKDYLKHVTILKLLESDENIPRPPFVEDASELDLSELLDRIEAVEIWKKEVLTFLKNKVEALNFPMIPGDVPVDLRNERINLINQLIGTAAPRNSIASFKSYFKFIETMASSKNIMIEESLKQIKLMEKIDQSSLKYFKEVVGQAPIFQIHKDLEALDYSELLEFWFRLNAYNNKKTELVLLKCRDILAGWLKQYKSLPSHYLDIFNPLFLIFDSAITELNQPLDADEALNKFEFYLNGAISKAQEGLEKLKAFFYNKVTVSLPRITEAIGEVSPEIRKVYSFLETTITTKDQTLESIHRLIVETVHDYEYILLAKLMELLSISSKNLLRRISELQVYGINLQNLVGEQIEVFSQLIQADSSDMMSIEMITQSFVELDKILRNENLQKSLFEIIDSNYVISGRIMDHVQALGWKNASLALMPFIVKIKQARNAIQFWSFDLIAKNTIEVLTTSKDLISAIKQLEQENYDFYEKQISNDPSIPYYKSILSVFEFQLENCSREIFPLNELINSRKELLDAHNLDKVYDLLTNISKLKTQWQQEWLPLISKWHRVLFLFISDYKPTLVQDEKVMFLANAKREIEETYNHKPMVTYLTAAVNLYVSKK
jgi:hypothetical protein